jgi:8-oxo-dGTP pyrophosphatase MutT (NUDIX family)
VPRPSATVLVVRDEPFEVLMVRRHDQAHFASALVFPGGVVEPEDGAAQWLDLVEGADGLDETERQFRIAACRELFEEATMLLADDVPPHCLTPEATVRPFIDVVREAGVRLRLDALENFAHWLTPESGIKRFDTHFFICRAPAGQEAMCDGAETVALEWLSPVAALAEAERLNILFPTRMNLLRLAESSDSAGALTAAEQRPRVCVTPHAERSETGVTLRIPAEAGYGITEYFMPLRAPS